MPESTSKSTPLRVSASHRRENQRSVRITRQSALDDRLTATDGQSNVRSTTPTSNTTDDDAHTEDCHCICGGGDAEDWVLCGNSVCPVRWYHWECVELTKAPVGLWLCPSCRPSSSLGRNPLFPNLGTGSRATVTPSNSPIQPNSSQTRPQRKGVAIKKPTPKVKPRWIGWEELSTGEEEAYKAAVEEPWNATTLPVQRRSSVRQVPAVVEAEESLFVESGEEINTPRQQSQQEAGQLSVNTESEEEIDRLQPEQAPLVEDDTEGSVYAPASDAQSEDTDNEVPLTEVSDDGETTEPDEPFEDSGGSEADQQPEDLEIPDADENSANIDGYEADKSSEGGGDSDAENEPATNTEIPAADEHFENAVILVADEHSPNVQVPGVNHQPLGSKLPDSSKHTEETNAAKSIESSEEEWAGFSDDAETIRPDQDSEMEWETTSGEAGTPQAEDDPEDWVTTSEEMDVSEDGEESDASWTSTSEVVDGSDDREEQEENNPPPAQIPDVTVSDNDLQGLSAYDRFLYSTIPR